MNDKKFLCWIHQRLVKVHGENPFVDYMHKLRAIISETSEDEISTTSDNTVKAAEVEKLYHSLT